MRTIVRCNCGCGSEVIQDGDGEALYFRSSVSNDFEQIKFITPDGLINGKYSLLRADILEVMAEMEFVTNK